LWCRRRGRKGGIFRRNGKRLIMVLTGRKG
jgi:hypothetical protein